MTDDPYAELETAVQDFLASEASPSPWAALSTRDNALHASVVWHQGHHGYLITVSGDGAFYQDLLNDWREQLAGYFQRARSAIG